MVLMFQREVAERLAAAPGSAAYGRLSVLVQWLCEVRIALHLPGRAFVPPPQVSSSVVQLMPRPQPLAPADKPVARARAGGGVRPAPQDAAGQPEEPDCQSARPAGGGRVPPTARAEEIDVAGFCRLARSYAAPRMAADRISARRPELIDEFAEPGLTMRLQALGREDLTHARHALLEIAVDQHVVVLGEMGHVGRDLAEAPAHHRFGILGAPPQPSLQLGHRRRQDEHADHVGARLAQLLGALPVDVEQDVAARGERLLDRRARRAVAMAVDLGVLQQLAGFDHRAVGGAAR